MEKTENASAYFMAFGTNLRSHIGVDFNYFDAFPFSLIVDEILQLQETPTVQNLIHPFSFSSLLNSFQIFHYNSPSFTVRDNFLTNVMVSPSHKPFLSARQLFQEPLGRLCAFSLENRTKIIELPVNLLCTSISEKLIIRYHSEVIYSDVNSDCGIDLPQRNILFKTEQKESPSLSINPKQTFAKIPTEILGITFRDAEWHFYPTFDGGKRQKIAINQGISWKIILDRTLFDDWLGLGFFQNSATLLNAGDRNLARQSNRTQVLINKRMKPNVIIDFIFPTFIDAELHSFFENFESPNDFRQSLNLKSLHSQQPFYRRY